MSLSEKAKKTFTIFYCSIFSVQAELAVIILQWSSIYILLYS